MTPVSKAGEVDLGEYLTILRKRWPWLIGSIILLVALATAYTLTRPEVYQATARVLLAQSAAQEAIDGSANNVTIRNRDLANEINLAESDQALQIVRERLGLGPDDDPPPGTISADTTSDVLEFRFNGTTAQDAALYANTWATAYVDVKQAKAEASIAQAVGKLEETLVELRDQRADIRADLDDLELRLARAPEDQRESLQLQVDREAGAISGELTLIDARIQSNIQSITTLQLSGELAAIGEAELSQEAVAPDQPANAPLSRNIAIAVVLGSLMGAGLALLMHNLDQTISDPDDLTALGLSTLTVVPKASREMRRGELALAGIQHPGSSVADAYQKARTALQFAAISNEMRSIVVTSPNQSEGKTTTSVNLALAFSSVGKRVVLADADLRRPRIHSVFSTSLVPGITDSILNGVAVDDIAVRTAECPDTLAALPAGTQPPNPAPFLASQEVARLTASLISASELLIFDAPPVLAVADALSISHHCDGVVLVVSAGSTKKNEIRQSLDSIRQAGGEVLGAVLIGVEDTGRYGRYYEDSSDTKGGRKAKKAKLEGGQFAVDLRDGEVPEPETEPAASADTGIDADTTTKADTNTTADANTRADASTTTTAKTDKNRADKSGPSDFILRARLLGS